jgi:DNA-binding transcriptional MerR regulator
VSVSGEVAIVGRRRQVSLAEVRSMPYFGTKELARLTGVSISNLQFWCESRLLFPGYKGGDRQWTPLDAETVSLISQLRGCHVQIGKIRRVLKALSKREAHPRYICFFAGKVELLDDDASVIRRSVEVAGSCQIIALTRPEKAKRAAA